MGSFTVSLVIPTLNAETELQSLVKALLLQTIVPDEIIVIDSSSDDSTAEIVRSLERTRLISISRSEFDHGGTRHSAFEVASGDFVLFMTQDAMPVDSTYIENLLKPFSDAEVAMVSGRQMPKRNARRYEQLVREFNYPNQSNVRSKDDIRRLGIKTFFASDVCSAYRREPYFSCGGFERPCGTNEDMLMAAKLIRSGWKVAYAADAMVFHSHNLGPIEQYRRNYGVGYSLAKGKELIGDVSEIGEGRALAKFVGSKLFQENDVLELCAFGLDCVVRVFGNHMGRVAAKKNDATVTER